MFTCHFSYQTAKLFDKQHKNSSAPKDSGRHWGGILTWKPMPGCLGYGMPAGAKRGPLEEPAARRGRKVKRKNGALGPKNRVAAARPSTAVGMALPRARGCLLPSASFADDDWCLRWLRAASVFALASLPSCSTRCARPCKHHDRLVIAMLRARQNGSPCSGS